MSFDRMQYVPTLPLQSSGVMAVRHLPKVTKGRMTPCFLFPQRAKPVHLSRSLEIIERAYHQRRYFLDIDRHYSPVNKAQSGFVNLNVSDNGLSSWTSLIEQSEWIMPCLQTEAQSIQDIENQIKVYETMGRTYCFRILRDFPPLNMVAILNLLSKFDPSKLVIFLEGGWTEDSFQLESWFRDLLISIISPNIDPDVPIVISCTSWPKAFSSMQGITRVPFSNRSLFQNLKADLSLSLVKKSYEAQVANSDVSYGSQTELKSDGMGRVAHSSKNAQVQELVQLGQPRLIYGDWGSTRPRGTGQIAQNQPPRIDYPTADAWYVARNKNENWGFHEAAAKMVGNAGVWCGNLGIWGEDMILRSASRYPFHQKLGVTTAPKNVAARINIHLHRQAFYDEAAPGALDLDEDWEEQLINQFNF
ncbi:MAG: hypothetical protein ISN29_11875 [Gammaproteobacteria bacterium AqS3]|nr:hypothetical protein [Gammaproteobacteria bacterium AqS3]